MTNGKVTIKDVYEAVQGLRSEIQDTYVTKETFKAEIAPIKQDVQDIQSNLSRGVWIVISGVIIAVLALIGLKV